MWEAIYIAIFLERGLDMPPNGISPPWVMRGFDTVMDCSDYNEDIVDEIAKKVAMKHDLKPEDVIIISGCRRTWDEEQK